MNPTGMAVESPVRGDVHAGLGGRVGETERLKGRHRAPARPYTFRFNRRRSRARGMLFYRLLEQAVQAEPRTYRSLVADSGTGPRDLTPPPANKRVRPASLAGASLDRPWRRQP